MNLKSLSARAQAAADRDGTAYAVLNLNRVGAPMLAVREYRPDDMDKPGLVVAGPFHPAVA
jgi:hypothetical protein